jgi:hypothetical protein
MEKNYLRFVLLVIFTFLGNLGFAQSGIYESYVIVDSGSGNQWFDLNYNSPLFEFQGSNLGTFTSANALYIKGGQNRIYKCGSDDIISGWLNYRVYPSGSPSGGYSGINLNAIIDNFSGAACSGSGDNQDWTTDNNFVDEIISTLGTAYGNYTIEVYTLADYTYSTGSGVHYINNGGSNYTATFIFCDATVGPVFNAVPADVSVECTGDVPVMTDLGWTDNCDGTGTVTGSDSALVGGACGGTITRTWAYTDSHVNPSSATQIITVDDTTDPTASNQAAVNVQCIGDVPVVDISAVTDEADNCTASPTVAHVSDVSDNGTCPEVITRTYRNSAATMKRTVSNRRSETRR